MMTRFQRLLAAAIIITATCGAAAAQNYPSEPVHLFVGFAAGGSTDIIARDLGHELEKVWGQPVVIENRPGANGAVAAATLAKARPDGHTLMMIVSGHITNALMSPSLPFDPIKDFSPVSLVGSSPLLVFAHPSFPASDIKTLIALAKEKPGTISYATPGTGSIQHLSMELLAYLADIKLIHVPYRGGSLALNDVIGGHVPLSVLSVFQALPYLQNKQLKALAVTSTKRVDVLPDVPTLSESGVPGYEAALWFGIIAPAGTPEAVVAKINADVKRIIQSPEMRAKFALQGADPIGSTQAEFLAFMRAEYEKWGRVIRQAHIAPQ
jgi:tripartite-type tricarboxylate transporter receptor subunit TctC